MPPKFLDECRHLLAFLTGGCVYVLLFLALGRLFPAPELAFWFRALLNLLGAFLLAWSLPHPKRIAYRFGVALTATWLLFCLWLYHDLPPDF
ncbi:hypothetical protein [Armatimonas sp.]|uniref:hypothetical protein n=1 Tax=Armatimonas sp. TaxID=1872638 RepID=UPI00286A481C|nr:hypothetical protein [Armatimonas sp.]